MGAVSDPIFSFIDVGNLTHGDLVDTAIVQRLRRLKQLQTASIVFPGATHTRFSHSLGVVQAASDICESIGVEDSKIVQSAALLHDIGHGPYSHVFEDIGKRIHGEDQAFDHDDYRETLVENDPGIREELGEDLRSVLDVLRGEEGWEVEHSIINSGLDADKLDYVRRDGFHSDVKGTDFDYRRIVDLLEKKDVEEKGLAIRDKGIEAVDAFRVARLNLTRVVHHHPAVCAPEGMLINAVERAIDQGEIEAVRFSRDLHEDHSEWFREMGDYSFLRWLMENTEDPTTQDLVQGAIRRELFKQVYRFSTEGLTDVDRIEELKDADQPTALAEKTISEEADVPAYAVSVRKIDIERKHWSGAEKIEVYYPQSEWYQVLDEVPRPTYQGPSPEELPAYLVFASQRHRHDVERAAQDIYAVEGPNRDDER